MTPGAAVERLCPVDAPALRGYEVLVDFLDLLCCPETHQPLRVATADEVSRLAPAPEAALIREDGLAAYPIRNGIPLLLVEEQIRVH